MHKREAKAIGIEKQQGMLLYVVPWECTLNKFMNS